MDFIVMDSGPNKGETRFLVESDYERSIMDDFRDYFGSGSGVIIEGFGRDVRKRKTAYDYFKWLYRGKAPNGSVYTMSLHEWSIAQDYANRYRRGLSNTTKDIDVRDLIHVTMFSGMI